MKYAIIAYGSRGDVQPYIDLSLGLMGRGHEVTLLAPENFEDFVKGYGVSFFPLHGNLEELIYSAEAPLNAIENYFAYNLQSLISLNAC